MKALGIFYWTLFGAWLSLDVVVYFEARRESGGAMDLAGPFFCVFTAGGIIFFLLAHVLIRKLSKEKPQ